MRWALTYALVWAALAPPCDAAERRSWNKVHYVGGTVPIKTSPYDWDTKLTIAANPDAMVLVIAPSRLFAPEQTVRIKASQVISLSAGPAAWQHAEAVSGSQLPPKPHSLFGLWEAGYMCIVYEADNGKRGAILLDSYFSWQILAALGKVTGKAIDRGP